VSDIGLISHCYHVHICRRLMSGWESVV